MSYIIFANPAILQSAGIPFAAAAAATAAAAAKGIPADWRIAGFAKIM